MNVKWYWFCFSLLQSHLSDIYVFAVVKICNSYKQNLYNFFLEQICILVNIFSAANLREVFRLIIEKNGSQENVMCDFLEDIVFSFETFRIPDESSIITACSRFSAQWLWESKLYEDILFEAHCIHIDVLIWLIIDLYFVTLFIAVEIAQLNNVDLRLKI